MWVCFWSLRRFSNVKYSMGFPLLLSGGQHVPPECNCGTNLNVAGRTNANSIDTAGHWNTYILWPQDCGYRVGNWNTKIWPMQQGQGCVTLLHLMKSNVSVLLCSFKPILEYIDTQFEKYLEEELKIKRSLFSCHDSRIHACLYFIAPSGHSLKSLDLVTMKKLDSKVTRQSIQKQRYLCLPFFPRVILPHFFFKFHRRWTSSPSLRRRTPSTGANWTS